MGILPQLIDPSAYRPCDWDLGQSRDDLAYWVNLFCEHLKLTLSLIAEEYPDATPATLDELRRVYLDTMQGFLREPQRYERVNVLLLTELRRDVVSSFGFDDPFAGVKRRENVAALEMLPARLAELDALPPAQQPEALAFGLMAGNMFDLGSMPTVARYRSRQMEFKRTLEGQPARPWFIDDLDAWRQRWTDGPGYQHVFMFVDNAGSDICLGCMPLARWMLRAGARVTLAANTGPALNDITASELRGLLDAMQVCNDRLSAVASGSTTPLLNLTALSDECVSAARDADLIILHGMGRGIESNYSASMTCDVLRTAVLKDPTVARHMGGKLFDCVFRLTPATQP